MIMTAWQTPDELNRLQPRTTKPRGNFLFAVSLPALLNVVFLAGLAFGLFHAFQLEHLIITGVQTEGVIIALPTRQVGGRSPHTEYYAAYQYHPIANDGTSVKNTIYQRNGAPVLLPQYQALHIGDKVKVSYDAAHPTESAVPFEISLGGGLSIMSGILVVIASILLVSLIRKYQTQKNLLMYGAPTQASITSKKEFTYRGNRTFTIGFTFRDGLGSEVHSSASNVPAKVAEEEEEKLTALYDVHDSSKNALYPLPFVKLKDK